MWAKIRKQVAGDWEKMAELVLGCEETFAQLESEIVRFFENQLPEKQLPGVMPYSELDGRPGVKEVSQELFQKLII